MEHKSLRVLMITDIHSDAIQSCSLTCQFTNLLIDYRGTKTGPISFIEIKWFKDEALQIWLMDLQIGGEWQNGIEVFAVII